jgi:hypothetical protein
MAGDWRPCISVARPKQLQTSPCICTYAAGNQLLLASHGRPHVGPEGPHIPSPTGHGPTATTVAATSCCKVPQRAAPMLLYTRQHCYRFLKPYFLRS